MSDGGEQIPSVDNILDMDLSPRDERKWIVLYDEDYDNHLIDGDDTVALLVDQTQAAELLRLANLALADLAAEDPGTPDDDPIDVLIDELEEVRDAGE